jgi:hypothetical protein
MSIITKTMTVNLQIGIWMGRRLDKEASRELTNDKGADADAARVNTHLIPKEKLQPIVSASGAIRTHFYHKTLPWKDNGDRLLVRGIYMPFIQEHERLVRDFDNAVDHFLTRDYLAAQDQAAFRMGELFRSDVYPHPDQLRRRFYVGLDIDAVTEAGDFRVEMDTDQINSVRRSMEEAMQSRMGKAVQDVWERLASALGHFAEKMNDTDAKFRDTTVKNLEEIVDMLPHMNIFDDPELTRIGEAIKDKLIGFDAKDLRKDPHVRGIAGTEAAKIMEDMAGFMKAFGGQS